MTDTEYLTTREVAALLRLKERKVYDLASEQAIPCTRATGKLLFSRTEVMRWLQQHSSGVTGQSATRCFSGSHDPLL
ncbi:MAG: helix-turn-helix domain-containing protein, partial [Pseudomonadota bacterium]